MIQFVVGMLRAADKVAIADIGHQGNLREENVNLQMHSMPHKFILVMALPFCLVTLQSKNDH